MILKGDIQNLWMLDIHAFDSDVCILNKSITTLTQRSVKLLREVVSNLSS